MSRLYFQTAFVITLLSYYCPHVHADPQDSVGTLESVTGFKMREIEQPEVSFSLTGPNSNAINAAKKLRRSLGSLPPVTTTLCRKYSRNIFSPPETACDINLAQITGSSISQPPWSANCFLKITIDTDSETGEEYTTRGTGWLVAPNVVLTAGHCVHFGEGGGFFKSIEVIPACDLQSSFPTPFGMKKSSNFRASKEWITDGKISQDYGAIILDEPFKRSDGSALPHFKVGVMDDQSLKNAIVNIAGYPDNMPSGTQWFGASKLIRVDDDRLYYRVDTFSGMSGSAVVYRKNAQDRTVIGIHNYGGCPNKCTRITEHVFTQITKWIDEAGRQ